MRTTTFTSLEGEILNKVIKEKLEEMDETSRITHALKSAMIKIRYATDDENASEIDL